MILSLWGYDSSLFHLNSSLTYTKRADRVTQNQEKIKEDDSPIINEFISIDETIFLWCQFATK